MEFNQWRQLRRRLTLAAQGQLPEIDRIWQDPIRRAQINDIHDILEVIIPGMPVNEDVIFGAIDNMMRQNRRVQTPLSWWLLTQTFKTYPSIQLGVAFSNLINFGSINHDSSQRVQIKHMLTNYPWYDLLLQIPRDAFDLDVSGSVLDCDRPNENFLASISCTGLWQDFLQPIPYPETYRELLAAVFALGVNLNILNPDLSLHLTDNQRASRSLTEQSSRIRQIAEHAQLNIAQINEYATGLASDWTNEVERHWQSGHVRRYGFQDSRGRSMTPPPRHIEYVNYGEYTPYIHEGRLDAEVYRSFFDLACHDDTRLDALRGILRRYAEESSVEIPQGILEGWRQGICNWLRSEQNRRSEDCSNRRDPTTLVDIEDIPLLFLWKIPTETGSTHCFDLIALFRHLRNDNRNPLTRERFSEETVDAIRRRYQFIYELMRAVLEPIA